MRLNLRYFLKKITLRKILFTSILSILILYYLVNKQKQASHSGKNDIFQDQRAEVLKFHQKISRSEFKVFSQQKEDGVLDRLIKMFDLDKTNKYFVEIGTQSGVECNSRYLREILEWNGIMFDGGFENLSIALHKETITHWNILDLFKKYNITNDISILSEDTDYADYWVVEAILSEYTPKVVVHEVNQMPPYRCVVVPKEKKLIYWDGSFYHGGSVCAFYCLAKRFNYTMVYCESNGVDCFWVRNDLLEEHLNMKANFINSVLTPQILYNNPGWVHPTPDYEPKWVTVTC